MITEINDLDHLLTQCESDRVLVGPLMSLPISASYRYFYLAARGSKVYQSIGLGFLEDESHAQEQRAEIIEKLKTRFAELVSFDSHTEMARSVHTHWPTEETARVLAAAEGEAKAASAPQADREIIDERGDQHTLRNEQSEPLASQGLPEAHQSTQPVKPAWPNDDAFVEEEQPPITEGEFATEPAATPFEHAKLAGQQAAKSQSYQKDLTAIDEFRELGATLLNGSRDKRKHADGSAPAELMRELQGAASLSSHRAPTKTPSTKDANDGGPSKDHLRDNLTRELLKQAGRDEAGSIRLPPAATLPPSPKECGEGLARQKHRGFGLAQDNIASAILKLASPADTGSCPIPSVQSNRGLPESPAILASARTPSHPERVLSPVKHTRGRSTVLRLVALVAAIVLFWTFVPPRTRQEVDQTDNALLAEILPSKSAAAVPLLAVSQPAQTSGSVQRTEAARRTVPSPAAAAPSGAERSDIKAPPVSERHGDLSDTKEISKLVSGEMEPLKSGDLKSARLSLQRDVQATPSPAAVPSQVESSRSIGLPDTNQLPAVKQPGPLNEHSSPIKSSDASQSAKVASLEPRVAPVSGHMAPTKEESTSRHLDSDEIAVLLSRGMDFLKSGDFASARVTLRRAAEAGNADAAFALGSTYDPAVLRQLGAVSIAADVAQAREWYEKAVDFGSAAAAQRLAKLAQSTR